MIFKNNNGSVKPLEQKNFKLEKELQKLTENNLGVFFGLEFLDTEFSLESFRFDTLAYDPESNSFVIIEYKKGKNDGLVDQGYAYLNVALNRKADLVLFFNRKKKENRQIEDFNWDEIRVYFVSPRFNEHQKAAVSFAQMPFRLFEVSQYDGGIVSVNEYCGRKIKENLSDFVKTENVDRVSKQVSVHTEEEHFNKMDDAIAEVYTDLKDRILALGDVEMKVNKFYIAFKKDGRNFVDIETYKSNLKVFINVSAGELHDPDNVAKDFSNTGHHGNGDYAVTIKSLDELDYLMTLIRQSYQK